MEFLKLEKNDFGRQVKNGHQDLILKISMGMDIFWSRVCPKCTVDLSARGQQEDHKHFVPFSH